MTEKEKMLRGMLYDADDSTLCADRVRAKELCHAYNQLRPSDAAGMRELLQQLLGETVETFCVTAPFWCDYGYNIRLGEHFYANHNLVILDCAAVTFGEHVFVAPNCGFYTAGHPIDAECRERGLEYAYPITVGDHVWRRCAGHARRHDREQCRDRGRQRRRQRHSERFGRCRQSVQGHSADHGGGQTDLLGQIARLHGKRNAGRKSKCRGQTKCKKKSGLRSYIRKAAL